MPRPGLRPYECVRRAWHSDRHQPMRGSLIQEIFRVVNEIHSSATKKNKEWQEKLPIVVLKAEEIMYAKANSEAEYMDLKSVWDRANDAIYAIIRLDETTETGVFLQPCIEAALNLGCTPRRASRSQRNNNPSYYLSANSPEPISVPSSNLQNTTPGNHTTNSPYMSDYLDVMRSTTTSFACLGMASHSAAVQNNCSSNNSSLLPGNFPSIGKHQCLSTKTYPPSNSWSVYPVYYGDYLQSKESEFSFDTPTKLNSHSMELGEMSVKQNPSSSKADALNKITQADIRNTPENSNEIGCDLSLRLGRLGVPCTSIENSLTQEVEDVGSRTSREGNKFSDSFPLMDNKSLHTCSSKWSSETEILSVKKSMRKRKACS